MANTHETLTSLFTDIADSIREVSGSEDTIVADDFPTAISALSNSSVEITLLAEVPIDDYNVTDYTYFVNSSEYSVSYSSDGTIQSVSKKLSSNTNNYEALLIVFSHGSSSNSSPSMVVALNGTSAYSRDATAMVVAGDLNKKIKNTIYAFLVNDVENSTVYTSGCWADGSGDGYKVTYDSDDIFNDVGTASFSMHNYYTDGYYAVYGINGIQAVANLLPQNS